VCIGGWGLCLVLGVSGVEIPRSALDVRLWTPTIFNKVFHSALARLVIREISCSNRGPVGNFALKAVIKHGLIIILLLLTSCKYVMY
jgi:hypothetical protein